MEVTENKDKTYNLTVKIQNTTEYQNRDITIQAKTKCILRDLVWDIHRQIDQFWYNKHQKKLLWTEYKVMLILNGASMENAFITDKYDMSTNLDNIIGLSEGSVLTAIPLAYAQSKYRGGKRSKEAKSDYIMAALDSIGRHYDNSPADSNDNLGGKMKVTPQNHIN